MFSGIVEEIGTVEKIDSKKNLSVLKVRSKNIFKGAKKGASVAVNGACLTITDVKKGVLTFDVMQETLLKTTLGSLKTKDRVNLEPALKTNSRIDGHFVTGHVDAVGILKEKVSKSNYTELRVSLQKDLAKFIASKGSVSLDGVSLTVGEVRKNDFSVYLIPFTKQITTLGVKKKGDKINIETDILAKYVLNNK